MKVAVGKETKQRARYDVFLIGVIEWYWEKRVHTPLQHWAVVKNVDSVVGFKVSMIQGSSMVYGYEAMADISPVRREETNPTVFFFGGRGPHCKNM